MSNADANRMLLQAQYLQQAMAVDNSEISELSGVHLKGSRDSEEG
jgi:hypothetical protein